MNRPLIGFLCLMLYHGAQAQEARLTPSHQIEDGVFGHALALTPDGRTALIGSPGESLQNEFEDFTGAAYLFRFTSEGWIETDRVTPVDSGPNAGFGNSVALSANGKTMAVGAFLDNQNGLRAGAAYVYESISDRLSNPVRITPSDAKAGDWFGSSVSLNTNGTVLAVSSRGAGGFLGSVYVFNQSSTGWFESASLAPPESAERFPAFGHAVVLSPTGDELWVGSPLYEGSGAVFGYVRQDSDWSLHAVLQPDHPDGMQQFGYDLSLSPDGNWLAVGSCDPTGFESSVLFYSRSTSGWERQSRLNPESESPASWFGCSVALGGEASFVAVGARAESSTDYLSGAGYVYTRKDSTWVLHEELRPSVPIREMRFGHRIAVDYGGFVVLVGARTDAGFDFDAGAVYAFGTPFPVSISEDDTPSDNSVEISIAPHPIRGDPARIQIQIPETQPITVQVFDLLGRPVASLFDGVVSGGVRHSVSWNVGTLSTGIYILHIKGPTIQSSRKVILVQ